MKKTSVLNASRVVFPPSFSIFFFTYKITNLVAFFLLVIFVYPDIPSVQELWTS